MIEFNFKFVLKEAIGDNGIDKDDIYGFKNSLIKTRNYLQSLRKESKIGFYDVPCDSEMIRDIKETAEELFSRGFTHLFVVGMGGSSLGAIFLKEAFDAIVSHRSKTETVFNKFIKKIDVSFSENIDPYYLSQHLESIDISKTLFCFVSKSGDTIEVVSQFFIIKEKFERLLGERYKEHFLFITDKKSGFLRNFADKNNLAVLNIAANIGGRYSIVTAASLFPAYSMGFDIDRFLEGIISERDNILKREPYDDNPVYTLAAILYLFYIKKKRNIFVIMPYSDNLREFARWFRQLFAESLGKDLKSPTPAVSSGATDQHSQLQLYMDGPQDKVAGFFCLKDYGFDYAIPADGFKNYNYLNNKKLSELLLNELKGVELALAMAGRPSFKVSLDKIDEFSLGELSFACMETVAVLGGLLGVNPFDQPGVEKGKKFAYLLTGKKDPSFSVELSELNRLEQIKDWKLV